MGWSPTAQERIQTPTSPSPQEIHPLREELRPLYPDCWKIEMQAVPQIFLEHSPLPSGVAKDLAKFGQPTCGHRTGLCIDAPSPEASKWDSCFYFPDLWIKNLEDPRALPRTPGGEAEPVPLKSALLFASSSPLGSTKVREERWQTGPAPSPPLIPAVLPLLLMWWMIQERSKIGLSSRRAGIALYSTKHRGKHQERLFWTGSKSAHSLEDSGAKDWTQPCRNLYMGNLRGGYIFN